MEVVMFVPHFSFLYFKSVPKKTPEENPTSPHYCIALCMSYTLQPFLKGGLCAVGEIWGYIRIK